MKKFSFAMLAALGLAISSGAGNVTAQPPPPCTSGNITFVNNTTVPVNICFVAPPAPGTVICSGTLAAGGGSVVVPVPVPTTVAALRSAGGANVTWVANPTPPPAWQAFGVGFNPGPGCFDLTYDPATCTITAVSAGGWNPCPNP